MKSLDQHKEGFLEFLSYLPITQMEDDIKGNGDLLIEYLYKKLNYAIDETKDKRYRKIYHDLGICSIYVFLDPAYGDPFRWILREIKKTDFELYALPPHLWRVNNTHKTGR